jgi:hypothetical protein
MLPCMTVNGLPTESTAGDRDGRLGPARLVIACSQGATDRQDPIAPRSLQIVYRLYMHSLLLLRPRMHSYASLPHRPVLNCDPIAWIGQ